MKCSAKVTLGKLAYGLHGRPSCRVGSIATNFQCNIHFKVIAREMIIDGKAVMTQPDSSARDQLFNCKSIMEIMMAGLEAGSRLEYIFDGDDAGEAMEALRILMTTDEYFAGTIFEELKSSDQQSPV